jgi:MarR family 2-MHQ and catechol resistance regulon transcriptional repressor
MSLAKELKMNDEFDSLQHEALLNIVRTAQVLAKHGQVFFQQYDLTEAQYNVLIVLKLEGRHLTQVELGERLVVSRANITALLDKLEKKGWVQRCTVDGDRRVFEIQLTDAGRKTVDKVEPLYLNEVKRCMRGLKSQDCRKLSQTLAVVRDTVGGGIYEK